MKSEDPIKIKSATWSPGSRSSVVASFLKRPAIDASAEVLARSVLADIRMDGDASVAKYAKQFDGASLSPGQFRVRQVELNAAREQVDAMFVLAARETHKRIAAFARDGLRKDWSLPSPKGGMIGEQFVPLDRVGLYIPGGSAPLVSTALMTVTLAKVAGVPEIVACSPVGPSRQMHPYLLYALELAGATEIYKIGGIQAIGAMAYGTATIPKVRKIAGPGGPYVTAAKRCVYGDVALDLVAGPSEIAVLADDSAPSDRVAADLLSQAEHGTGFEKCLLVTTSSRLAESVRAELVRQAESLSRRDIVMRVLTEGTLIVVVNHLDAGMELCNLFAPEHLEIIVCEPRIWLKKVRNAGAIFVGPCTPECVGDFAAGPSHVLPTGGTAAMFSGLTADDFRKRSSIIAYTRADLKDVLHIVEAFGRVEGLDAHARSARVRFNP
ncbi:MAG: histidinol dehydrogenase [Verrucomicrobia bacterium]|nr:histidinol dehydrogenase [Verrucomicrobiota bacterium]MBU4290460.1 histidinol dehydrogenase [Verrucomicrobiota bacterium]MBU4430056.1 histidinol dehydrogenase [Verrucomicrobiota bacterium]MCG2681117.1 histidinol dehydrogenase [Kiritimatiellia bacterium]